ncbi:hypothetical protein BBJ28_00020075, partial [Nothophytophthora sp. Chile5]
MDAATGARKRRASPSGRRPAAAPSAAPRKKARRDQSEFVSVSVGMREFRKRLASGGAALVPVDNGSTEEAAVSTATPKPRATAKPKTRAKSPVLAKAAAVKSTPRKAPVRAGAKSKAKPKAPAARKLTLAEVKLQLEREQQQRVESRIQTLQRGPSNVQQRGQLEGGEKAAASPAQQAPVDAHALSAVGKAAPTQSMQPGASMPSAPVAVVKNEFIADDDEEDLMFAMALEAVEQKLGTSKTLPPPLNTAAVPLAGFRASDVTSTFQPAVGYPSTCTASSAAPSAPVYNDRTPDNSQTPVPAGKLEASPAVMSPEVLEEVERLRRENELLRRSNELLQATAASSKELPHTTAECTHTSRVAAHDSDTADLVASTSHATPARYLDLGGDDRDHASDRATSAPKSERALEQSAEHPDLRNSKAETYQDRQPVDDGQEDHTGRSVDGAAVELAREHVSDTDVVPKAAPEPFNTDAEQRSVDQSSPAEPGNGHAPLEATGSDDGDVSDTNMSEEEEEEEEENEVDPERGEPPQRSSTIDNGNYAEYKKPLEDEVEGVDTERADDEAVLPDEKASPAVEILRSEAQEDSQTPETPASSEVLGRTTAPSNTEDDDDDEEDDVVAVKPKGRLGVISSSESESEEDEELEASDSDDGGSSNMLEAALKAAGGDGAGKKRLESPSTGIKATLEATKQTPRTAFSSGREGHPVVDAAPASSASTPDKTAPRKRKATSLSTSSGSSKGSASLKSSLLWPALDEFYDFLLDLPPRNVRASQHKRTHLERYFGAKLPAQHATIEDYCGVQLEAIMEELVASVSNATDSSGGGGSGPTRRLSLTSVSPCGTQGSLSSVSPLGLSTGAIFSESGFSGAVCNNNDYILAFHAGSLGGKSSSDFVSGDLVLLRSPRWKSYELRVFGVVLCNSSVAIGGSNGGKGSGAGDSDQICVLIRAQKQDQETAAENFGVLTELCLSNQRSPNWRWTLQQVHNTTTSAREFQAVKSVAFFQPDLKQVLLRGKLSSLEGGMEQQQMAKMKAKTEPTAASSVLSPRLLRHLQKHYNDSQMQAILGCLGEHSRVIIQGPPGTGKTKTILGLLSALLDGAGLSTLQKAKGTARVRVGASLQSAKASSVSKTVAETSIRILVAAPSNAAVDELVVRLLSEGIFDGEKGESYRPRIVRVGRPENSQQLSSSAAAREASEGKKNRKKLRKYAREVEDVLLESLVAKHRSTFPTAKQARQAIIKNAQIVFCTLSGAGSVAMCDFAHDFDALIVDEAAQAVEASALIPLKFRPHRLVLVGDHRQLPATVISKRLVAMGYDRSLLQRLVENDSPVLLLTKQYRMHPDIAEFPSTYFY